MRIKNFKKIFNSQQRNEEVEGTLDHSNDKTEIVEIRDHKVWIKILIILNSVMIQTIT